MVVHPEEMTSARRIADCAIVGRGIFYLVLSFAGRLAQAFACGPGFKGVDFVGIGHGDPGLSPSPQLRLK
jgi:hypothetical protein